MVQKVRGFLHLTYKLYEFLNKLSGPAKGRALNVYLSLMKYAWKMNNYRCDLRHSTIVKDTNLSRNSVKAALNSLAKLNIVKIKKGRSGCTYSINTKFLKSEVSNFDRGVSNIDNKVSNIDTQLSNSGYIRRNNINTIKGEVKEVKDIIKKGYDKEKSLELLKLLPLPVLDKSIENNYMIYYCKLAKEMKLDAEKNSNLVDPKTVQAALRNVAKQTNSRYKEVKAYNIRNGIKPWK
jgi:predicted transcriptional regulator